MHLKVIACAVLRQEIDWLASRSTQQIDIEYLPQSYHADGTHGREALQARLDAIPPNSCDAVLLGYALCNNLLVGLTAPHATLVIPRAHDCITLFLGSKERYDQIFHARPGVYYFTAGWLEHSREGGIQAAPQGLPLGPSGFDALVEKYGEEAARYVMETLGQWVCSYSHGALITEECSPSGSLAAQVREICAENGWQYDEIPGDLALLRRWLNGEWRAEEFLIVPPGARVIATYDAAILGYEPAP